MLHEKQAKDITLGIWNMK